MELIEIVIILVTLMIIFLMPTALWSTGMKTEGLEFCNPCWLYKEKKLCVFSCVFTAIFANLTTLPYALGYWFYKACTIRRK